MITPEVRDGALLVRARALTAFVGDGRPVTAKGVPRRPAPSPPGHTTVGRGRRRETWIRTVVADLHVVDHAAPRKAACTGSTAPSRSTSARPTSPTTGAARHP